MAIMRQVLAGAKFSLRILSLFGFPLLWFGKAVLHLTHFFLLLPLRCIKVLFTVAKNISWAEPEREKSEMPRTREEKVAALNDPWFYSWEEYGDWASRSAFGAAFEVAWWWKLQRRSWEQRKREWQWVRMPRISVPTVVPASLSFILLVSPFVFGAYEIVLKDLPSPELLRERDPQLSTKIYDREGNLLYLIFKDENRVLVPLEEISPTLIQATIAIEDDEFYNHLGLSAKGIARAFRHNLENETVQGGSTITQQLVKMTLLSPEKTWQRKLREAVLALQVDYLYEKDEILYYYLNEMNYGGSVYGIEQASQWYFSKPARDLDLAESAFLAGLPQAPSAYSPFGSSPERSYQRQQEVLRRMVEEGFITHEQALAARDQQLAFRNNTYDIQAPHFVMFVRELLAQQYGEEMVNRGGLEVWTTLDSATQASAEAAVRSELDRLGRLRVSNGAALVTDPRSGEILAMVGSRNYFDEEIDGKVNVALRPRQPGSSIKPITYVTAFERGFTPSSMIQDTPVVYRTPGSPPWSPRNYDGTFHGNVTLREALGSSYNIPAVRLLVEVGLPAMIQKAQDMGISTWEDTSRFGLSLTLGGGEVTMYDMAKVYGTFANTGYTVDLNPLLLVKNHEGEVLYQNPCAEAANPCNAERTVSPLAAYQITSILTDNSARSPAFGRNSVLFVPGQEVAVKTGTTNSLRDNWTIGYTSDRVVVTWVGNNDNTPMSAVASGVTGASPIWRTIMDTQLEGRVHAFAPPSGLEKVAICRTTGTLPCGQCSDVVEEVFLEGTAPTQRCTAEMFAQREGGEEQDDEEVALDSWRRRWAERN